MSMPTSRSAHRSRTGQGTSPYTEGGSLRRLPSASDPPDLLVFNPDADAETDQLHVCTSGIRRAKPAHQPGSASPGALVQKTAPKPSGATSVSNHEGGKPCDCVIRFPRTRRLSSHLLDHDVEQSPDCPISAVHRDRQDLGLVWRASAGDESGIEAAGNPAEV